MNRNTCCFTGHRKIPAHELERICSNLNREIDILIELGITDFISGGALGFDQIAASLVLAKKELGKPIRLIFALPCRNQDNQWSREQQRLYHDLLQNADEIFYVSEEYTPTCMKERNQYMIARSGYCICALLNNVSGTGQTIRLARQRGIKIINVAR